MNDIYQNYPIKACILLTIISLTYIYAILWCFHFYFVEYNYDLKTIHKCESMLDHAKYFRDNFTKRYAEDVFDKRIEYFKYLGIEYNYETDITKQCEITMWTINKLLRLCEKKYHPDLHNISQYSRPKINKLNEQFIQCREIGNWFKNDQFKYGMFIR